MALLKDVEEGQYSAKMTNYGLKNNEHLDKVECMIQMQFKAGDDFHHIVWRGFFTKKDGSSSRKTIDTLLCCGFEKNDPSLLAAGPESGLLDMDKKYQVTLERNDGGYIECTWINPLGGQMFEDVLSTDDAVKSMKGLKIGGDFMNARKEYGKPRPKKDDPPEQDDERDPQSEDFGPEPSFDSSEEIPF